MSTPLPLSMLSVRKSRKVSENGRRKQNEKKKKHCWQHMLDGKCHLRTDYIIVYRYPLKKRLEKRTCVQQRS